MQVAISYNCVSNYTNNISKYSYGLSCLIEWCLSGRSRAHLAVSNERVSFRISKQGHHCINQYLWMVCPERTFKEFLHDSSSPHSHVTDHTVPLMLVVPKGGPVQFKRWSSSLQHACSAQPGLCKPQHNISAQP